MSHIMCVFVFSKVSKYFYNISFRMLESSKGTGQLDINCCDPLGRSALLMAIDNENLEIIEMLIDNKVRNFNLTIYYDNIFQ